MTKDGLSKDGLKTVLIADDSFFYTKRVGDALTEAGYDVIFARDGKEAEKIIKDSPEGVDLLMLNFLMPQMDAFGVLDWIKANGYKNSFPILAITGEYNPDEVLKSLKEFREKAFIPKGLPLEDILAAVDAFLSEGIMEEGEGEDFWDD